MDLDGNASGPSNWYADLEKTVGAESAQLLLESMRAASCAMNGSAKPGNGEVSDPMNLEAAVAQLAARLAAEPARVVEKQLELWREMGELWGYTVSRSLGFDAAPVATPARDDRRFRHEDWSENPWFDHIKQAYLLVARASMSLISEVDGLDADKRRKLEFSTQQIIDAVSPTNFAATNPEVVRLALETGGKNLVTGLQNLLRDLDPATGRLSIRMVDPDAYVVGESLAATPGEVVFQNELMQLIQYAPSTPKVKRRPLLIVPPWMNKYYVMDLRPANSLVRWLVGQGFTVFMVSWINPDSSLGHKGFEDYMLEGPVAAVDAIEKATGESEVNVAGYCLGGILLAATVAYLSAKKDTRIKSATYLTTMVDFSEFGEIDVFIDEAAMPKLEASIKERGYLSGQAVADTWRSVRANDLVWSFYISNYLLGNPSPTWDILYWNADSTNMPAAMHTFFMRNMYLDNRLREPGGVTLAGVPIDVTKAKTPAYILSTVEDHIAPWKTTYESTQLFAGPVRFVLGASGHIAGVINPPDKDKYGYWTGDRKPADPDAWLASAKEHHGSWWPDWDRWLSRRSGGQVAARNPGSGKLRAIEAAPGSYVMRPMPND